MEYLKNYQGMFVLGLVDCAEIENDLFIATENIIPLKIWIKNSKHLDQYILIILENQLILLNYGEYFVL